MKASRTIHLRSGGSITLTLDGSVLKMSRRDRDHLFAMLDACDQYEAAPDRAAEFARWRGDEARAARNLVAAYRPAGLR